VPLALLDFRTDINENNNEQPIVRYVSNYLTRVALVRAERVW